MKVLYIVGGGKNIYGSEVVAMQIMTLLRQKYGVDFTVILKKKSKLVDFCEESSINYIEVPMKFYVYKPADQAILNMIKRAVRLMRADIDLLSGYRKVKRHVDISSFDLVLTNLSRDMLGAIIAKKYSLPHVWYLQEMFKSHYGLSPLGFSQISKMNKSCSRFIAISKCVADTWVDAGIDIEKIDIIYNAINVEDIPERKEMANENDKLKILMVGEISEEKGQEYLVEAVSKLNPEIRSSLSVDLYGTMRDSYYHCEELIEKHMLEEIVHICGYASDIKKKYCEYGVFINCSKGEGFGLSTIEAMAAGLLILAADTGANPELIQDGEKGFLFDYKRKVEEMKNLITKVFENRILINEMGGVSHRIVKSNYNQDAFGEHVYKTLTRVKKN